MNSLIATYIADVRRTTKDDTYNVEFNVTRVDVGKLYYFVCTTLLTKKGAMFIITDPIANLTEEYATESIIMAMMQSDFVARNITRTSTTEGPASTEVTHPLFRAPLSTPNPNLDSDWMNETSPIRAPKKRLVLSDDDVKSPTPKKHSPKKRLVFSSDDDVKSPTPKPRTRNAKGLFVPTPKSPCSPPDEYWCLEEKGKWYVSAFDDVPLCTHGLDVDTEYADDVVILKRNAWQEMTILDELNDDLDWYFEFCNETHPIISTCLKLMEDVNNAKKRVSIVFADHQKFVQSIAMLYEHTHDNPHPYEYGYVREMVKRALGMVKTTLPKKAMVKYERLLKMIEEHE